MTSLTTNNRVCFSDIKYLREGAIFTQERWQEGESVLSFTHKQNIICSQMQLDDIAHEQSIICRHLFAGQVVGSRTMKGKKNLHRMIINNNWTRLSKISCSSLASR